MRNLSLRQHIHSIAALLAGVGCHHYGSQF